jgi:hypothetical protein
MPATKVVGFCTERPSPEKPSVARARACLGAGQLWNTSVLVGRVATLVQTGWQALPELSDRLAHVEPFVGTPEEADAVRQDGSPHPDADPSGVGADAGPVGLIREAPRPAARQAEAATRGTGRSGGEVSVTWILQ